jgi:6-phosphogluconolactonase
VTRLTTLADAEAAGARAAREIARAVQDARGARGAAHIALSGGGTPRRAYELLARELDSFTGVHVWFADERCVGPEDEQSNYRLAAETLLAAAAVPDEQVHRMHGELGPHEGAERYASELVQWAPVDGQAPVPVLDLIVLGIGPDGHVASLFPGAATLDAGERETCLGLSDSPKPPPERITLTLGMLRAARRCLLMATGAGKADAVSAMLAEPDRHVPASLLRRERLTVIVDDAASPGRELLQ